MKNIFKIIFTFIMWIPYLLSAQNVNISGRVIEMENETVKGIPFANVALFSTDSVLITGISSNGEGYFTINNIAPSDYRMNISFIGYQSVDLLLSLDANKSKMDVGNVELVVQAQSLDEVTVTASNIINKLDRKIIFPTQEQIKKSGDGIELLRNLRLNGIEIKRSDNSVTGIRGGSVNLRINGASATTNELMSVNPKDIIRVEYLEEPSLRYGEVEAVVNYIVKRRESGGALLLSASNAVTTQWGEDMLSLKLNHRKSEFQFMYFYTYKGNESRLEGNENFKFENNNTLTRVENGEWGKYRYRGHNLRTSYSLLEQDKYLFLATFSYNSNSTPDNLTKSSLFRYGDESNAVNKIDRSDSESKVPTINLYYQRQLKNDQQLIFDLTGTYIETKQKRSYLESLKNKQLTSLYSNIEGDKYSLIAEGAYEKIFKVGRLSIGAKQTFSYTNNTYMGDIETETTMRQNYTNFYTEWFGRIKEKMTYSVGLGGMYSRMEQGDILHEKVLFTPTVRLGYHFNDRTELRYQGRVLEQSPALGDINDVEQAIDSLQIRKGNPNLLPYTSFVNSITFSSSVDKVNFYLDVSDHYSIDPIMESVYRINDKFVHTKENQKRWHQILTTAQLAYTSNSIYIYTKGGMNWIDSKGIDYRHILRHWFISSGFEVSWKKASFYSEITNGRKNIIGESISKRDNAVYAGVSYRINNLSLNAIAYFPLNDYISSDVNYNRYAFSEQYLYFKRPNTFQIKAVWSFEFGRKYKSDRKLINNSDNDSGILNIK